LRGMFLSLCLYITLKGTYSKQMWTCIQDLVVIPHGRSE
jgi:hypothetical protein